MYPLRRGASDRGVTIVEMLVATSLLAVGVLASVQLVTSASKTAAVASRREIAIAVAVDELEQMRSLPYESLGIWPSSAGYVPSFEGRNTVTEPAANAVEPLGEVEIDGQTYALRRYVTWADVDIRGATRTRAFKRLTVFVEWEDIAGTREIRQDSGAYEVSDGLG